VDLQSTHYKRGSGEGHDKRPKPPFTSGHLYISHSQVIRGRNHSVSSGGIVRRCGDIEEGSDEIRDVSADGFESTDSMEIGKGMSR